MSNVLMFAKGVETTGEGRGIINRAGHRVKAWLLGSEGEGPGCRLLVANCSLKPGERALLPEGGRLRAVLPGGLGRGELFRRLKGLGFTQATEDVDVNAQRSNGAQPGDGDEAVVVYDEGVDVVDSGRVIVNRSGRDITVLAFVADEGGEQSLVECRLKRGRRSTVPRKWRLLSVWPERTRDSLIAALKGPAPSCVKEEQEEGNGGWSLEGWALFGRYITVEGNRIRNSHPTRELIATVVYRSDERLWSGLAIMTEPDGHFICDETVYIPPQSYIDYPLPVIDAFAGFATQERLSKVYEDKLGVISNEDGPC